MIAWQPRLGFGSTWHLSTAGPDDTVLLCGIRVAGVHRYVKRDPHKIDHYGGDRCPDCWKEWRMRTGASIARQDQWAASQHA